MESSFESVLKLKNLAHLEKARRAGLTVSVRRVAFVLRENFSMMAFTGAVDALVTANLMSSAPLFEIRVVGGRDNLVVSDLGIAISTDCSLAELKEKEQDIIVVCGGFRVRLEGDPVLRSKLRSADAAGAILGGLWNGSYFLAEAGLLDGYDCAFHPDGRAMMSELFPGVNITRRSYVLDRTRISCAGANSSLGMMLEVVRAIAGQELVNAVEEVLNCDKMRDIVDVSVVSIDLDPTLPSTLKAALELMHSNIEEPIEVSEIARYVGISRRQLERQFCHHVNATPTRYYLELRLTYARQLLQHTNKPIAEVSVASGFVTASHFYRRFRSLFGITPRQFRSHAPG
ncbi:GlxA family transcriptional regulator [Pseudomonas indica]|uniref:Transcriptional regulator GlxA family, contains an amidase domain and an AraC-type DNA-binding HTH domain n=1 Tax=Pseudomonas indica TaxID=137658 RepID=A0A1G8ZZU4_9PSED|nr:GlxA family transcriptional regulator [Pseudomonas indica]SDK20628.1 Transcriptional regulator GlxA family, contains an amidase domain and an AraC-type DNA-binding HTH domain [Pseudomonas indica]